jgi:hypothetical protein
MPANSRYSVEYHMSLLSFVVSLFRGAISSVLTFLGPSWDGPVAKYHPERHYMRGPGPKWREKQLRARATSIASR